LERKAVGHSPEFGVTRKKEGGAMSKLVLQADEEASGQEKRPIPLGAGSYFPSKREG